MEKRWLKISNANSASRCVTSGWQSAVYVNLLLSSKHNLTRTYGIRGLDSSIIGNIGTVHKIS